MRIECSVTLACLFQALLCLPVQGQVIEPVIPPAVEPKQVDAAPAPARSEAQSGGQNEDQAKAPDRFIPKEKISPDSVISFPADI